MNYSWLEKRSVRSIDQLRLWSENPRLDPEEEHIRISDFVADLIEEPSEKKAFIDLIKSIATNGYIPSDPIIVWQDQDNQKFYVAEGNRRVLALKLLRNANKAPKSIRTTIKNAAKSLDLNDIAKIKVVIAPSFEACEWYITQRHATSSLQRGWSRLQQQRWIADLYEKYDKNIDKLQSATNLTKGDLDSTLRILKIRDMALTSEILSKLENDEQDKVKSHRIPMTILERWFGNIKVRECWGLVYDEDKVSIKSNISSFYNAYAELIKLIIHRKDPSVKPTVDTRTIDSDIDKILNALPAVTFDSDNSHKNNEIATDIDSILSSQVSLNNAQEQNLAPSQIEPTLQPVKHNDLSRLRLVIETGELITANTKLSALYYELKDMPVNKYPNCVATALRVFLDIAVAEHLKVNNQIDKIEAHFQNKKQFKDIELNSRLEFLKQNTLKNKQEALKVIKKLQNNSNEHSLDTLNNYVHGSKTHLTNKTFLNGFWDFLFPLFEEILDIKQ